MKVSTNNGNRTILIVDDDEQIIKVIKKILRDDGIDVIDVASVKEANKVLENIDIDLLVVDYFLTNGSGYDVIRKAKHENNSTPVIMVSGAGKNLKISSLEEGVNVYLEKPFNGRELRQIALNLLSLSEVQQNLENAQEVITALARAVEIRDEYTKGHSQRVSVYALTIYDTVGFDDPDERTDLTMGCLLHDIGKIGVPDDILKSDRRLTPEEFETIMMHPAQGWDICKDLKRLQGALPIIRHHHEKLDGSGYPDGLDSNEIPELVQIVTVADMFDALTSDRAYRDRNTYEEAFEIMEKEANSGKINKYFFDILKSIYLA